MDQRLSADAIFARLGEGRRDADFELAACDKCGRQALVDHECLRVYSDPHDLRVFTLNIEGQPWPECRGCGRADWDIVPAAEVAPSGVGRAGRGSRTAEPGRAPDRGGE
jgi:hypothetical protein